MIFAKITFSGRVQGVGFRDHVQSVALQYGILGTVKNNSGGKVTVEAEAADTKTLDDFIEHVKAILPGFSLIRVESAIVSEMYEKAEGDFASFEII